MTILKLLVPIFFLILACNSFGQKTDFNRYQTLISDGEIPVDFSSKTYAKIENDRNSNRTGLKSKQEKIFLKGIHYSIDQILHSGKVIFGDKVTSYINRIAAKLLANEPTLKGKLRFYTLKSNVVNAFSTDQGIIFITTGLIAHLENDSQLAFILSHEIAHYTEKHVVNQFDLKVNQKEQIEHLSSYSRSNELDADLLGLERYLKAGYSSNEVEGVFDILKTSHLPFTNQEVNKSDFDDAKFIIPDSFFVAKIYAINDDEDFDDSHSSHPNIKKRKEAIASKITLNPSPTVPNEQFLEIKKICQFESLRNYILDGDFITALYTTKFLQKNNESLFLKQIECQAYFGLAQYVLNDTKQGAYITEDKVEGNIGWTNQLLKTLGSDGIIAIAVRKIYDNKELNDPQVNALWSVLIHDLIIKRKLDVSKYAHAKNDKEIQVESKTFYFSSISDVIDNELAMIEAEILKADKEAKEEKQRYYQLSKNERENYDKDKLNKVEDFIVLEPNVFSFNKKGINLIKSEYLQENFSVALEHVEDVTSNRITEVGRNSINSNGIQSINDRALLNAYLNQITSTPTNRIVPVDYDAIIQLKQEKNTNYCMLFLMTHEYTLKGENGYGLIAPIGISLAWPPTALAFWPAKIISGNHTKIFTLLIDIDKNEILGKSSETYRGPLGHYTLSSYIYDIYDDYGIIKK